MINFEPYHLPIPVDLFPIRGQLFSQLQVWDAVEALKQALDGSELGNQACRGLLSDSLDSRYIVHAIATEGQNFAYTFGRNTPFVSDFRNSEERVGIFWLLEVALIR